MAALHLRAIFKDSGIVRKRQGETNADILVINYFGAQTVKHFVYYLFFSLECNFNRENVLISICTTEHFAKTSQLHLQIHSGDSTNIRE